MFDKKDETAVVITKPVRRLKVNYVRKRHGDPKRVIRDESVAMPHLR